MKTAIFGGTFDPVHNGHLAIAGEVLAQGLADRILFMPAPCPPHKMQNAITPFAVRFEMLALAVAGKEGFAVSDIEKQRPGRSYTIDTLHQVSQIYPDDCILLLIGGDSLRQLHTWKDAHEIVGQFGILSYPRPGEEITRGELRRYWSEEETEHLLRGVIRRADLLPVSSTDLRSMIRRGEWSRAEKLIPPAVADHIRKNKIYLNT
jgi:nicotinate-nucleotide adenylyltransferase